VAGHEEVVSAYLLPALTSREVDEEYLGTPGTRGNPSANQAPGGPPVRSLRRSRRRWVIVLATSAFLTVAATATLAQKRMKLRLELIHAASRPARLSSVRDVSHRFPMVRE
jgi:hypothetical protein